MPLLGIGGVGAHVGGLDVVPLLAAIAGCHCWAAIAGCHCWVALPLLAAIARWHVVRCHGKVPLLGAMW